MRQIAVALRQAVYRYVGRVHGVLPPVVSGDALRQRFHRAHEQRDVGDVRRRLVTAAEKAGLGNSRVGERKRQEMDGGEDERSDP